MIFTLRPLLAARRPNGRILHFQRPLKLGLRAEIDEVFDKQLSFSRHISCECLL
jgi:hypothetical protein